MDLLGLTVEFLNVQRITALWHKYFKREKLEFLIILFTEIIRLYLKCVKQGVPENIHVATATSLNGPPSMGRLKGNVSI